MTTSTLPFVSENAVLSALAAAISRFFKSISAPAAKNVPAAGEQSLMSLYRLASAGDSVSPQVAAALSRFAAR